MELNKIEALLIKYEQGETSLEEEVKLRDYFSSGDVPPHLWEYKLMFSYSKHSQKAVYAKDIMVNSKVKSFNKKYTFIGIAASILLALGIFSSIYDYNQQEQINSHDLGTIEDPEEAYLKAKETLQLVADALNTGKEELKYVNEFSNTTNKYLK